MCSHSPQLRLVDITASRVRGTDTRRTERQTEGRERIRGLIGTSSRGIHLSHKGRGTTPLPDPSGCRGSPCTAWKATGTMQLGLVVLAMIFLSSMGHSDVLKLSKARRQRRVSTEGPPSCPKGCDRCSEYNGCIKCNSKLFIFLERNDIRQIGVCLASCPVGYFGTRNPEGNNRCTQCKIDNCEACFDRNFCTKCKEGLYSHSGRCYVSCSPGQHTANETMECVGQHASECELGEWSQWSSCMKKNKTCGFRRGSQSRGRFPLPQIHSPDPSPSFVLSQTCVPETEQRKCVVTRTPCVRERKTKGDRQDDANRRDKENARGRGREGTRGGGGKRRKGQSRTTTAPSVTTSAVT